VYTDVARDRVAPDKRLILGRFPGFFRNEGATHEEVAMSEQKHSVSRSQPYGIRDFRLIKGGTNRINTGITLYWPQKRKAALANIHRAPERIVTVFLFTSRQSCHRATLEIDQITVEEARELYWTLASHPGGRSLPFDEAFDERRRVSR